MREDEWIDLAAAARRHHCIPDTIRRWTKRYVLERRLEESIGRDGRWAVRAWMRVRDLDEVTGVTARPEHVRKIRATAQPFTDEQKIALRKVFLAHLQDREEKRNRA